VAADGENGGAGTLATTEMPAADVAAASRSSVTAVAGPAPAATDVEAMATRFCTEIEALAGMTHRADNAEGCADYIATVLARTASTSIVGWSMEEIGVPGLGEALAARGIQVVPQELPFAEPDRAPRIANLAEQRVGLTGADAGLAITGSMVMLSGPGRGRLSSLLTPVHIAILRKKTLVPSLRDLFAADPTLARRGSNLVIITGPSRTADIEQTLTRGVHGPGDVHVILI
jgi:L-lactate dehydrogenase complex protein LldG